MQSLRMLTAASAIAGSLLFASPSWATSCSPGNLCFDINALSQTVSDIAVLQDTTAADSGNSGFSAGPTSLSIVDTTSLTSAPDFVFLMGVTDTGHLVLFTNTAFGGPTGTGIGKDFETLFSDFTESNLVTGLENFSTNSGEIFSFAGKYASSTIGFVPGADFAIVEFSDGTNIGDGASSFTPLVATTPLPPAWTMMLAGLAGLGLFANWRRRSNVGRTAA